MVNLNGERFAVMAGTGFDANMIRSADGGLKDKLGRAAYVWTGAKSFRTPPFTAKIDVDGSPWFTGPASCILAGNVGALFAGVRVFADAEPDDGSHRPRRDHRRRRHPVGANGGPHDRRQPRPVAVLPLDPRPAASPCGSTGRCATSWTAAIVASSSPTHFEVEPAAVAICVPAHPNGGEAT